MRKGFPIAVFALATIVVAGDLQAAPVRVSQLENQVTEAVAELKSARAKLRETTEAQATLAHRISALKRRGKDSPELRRLLQASTEADTALRAEISKVDRQQRRVIATVKRAFGKIDGRIRALAPRIATDPNAAAELTKLKDARERMHATLRSVKTEERRREWAKYVVKIDPLDGPEDLREKEAVLDLARRKLEKKRKALAQLIREKRMVEAADRFSVDTTVTDETVRPGRVTQGNDGRASVLASADNSETTVNAGVSPPAAPADPANQGGGNRVQDDANAFQGVGAAPPPGEQAPGRGETLNNAGDAARLGVGTPAAKSTVATVQPKAPNAVTRQLDPNQLLNLRVDGLSADVNTKTLQAWIAELERLEAELNNQAGKVRRRATQLERDEIK